MRIHKMDNNLTVVQARSGYFPFRMDVYFYIADGAMIDAGSAYILKQTASLLQKEKITCTAITHIHEDHTGAAAWIKNNLKVPVYIHKNSIAEAAIKSSLPLYRKIVWCNRDGFIADPLPPFIETGRLKLDVIDSPGHHPDHVVFHEKNRGWLFTGDMYVSRRQLVAFKDENMDVEIQTLKRLLELDFDTIFCAHSGVQDKGKEKLQSKLDFFLNIQNRVRTLEKEGMTHEEINRRLFPKMNLWEFISHGEWSTMRMIETI